MLATKIAKAKPKWWLEYNMDGGGLDKYRKAYDAVSNGAATIHNISFIGDSGGEATDLNPANQIENILYGYVGLCNAEYNKRFQNLGLGMLPVFVPNASTAVWTFDAGWGLYNAQVFGVCGQNKYNIGNNAVCTFTFTGTGVTVVALKATITGSFTAKVDGVSKGTFNTVNATIVNAASFVIAAAGTLSNAEHVLEITAVSAATPVLIIGAYALTDATRGFRSIRCCANGSSTLEHMGDTSLLITEIDTWSPILTVICLHQNDLAYSTVLATYKTRYQTLITRAKTFGDVLMFAMMPRGDAIGALQSPYIDVMRQLSNENNVPMIDECTPYLHKMRGYGFTSPDGVHAHPVAYRIMFEGLKSVLFKS